MKYEFNITASISELYGIRMSCLTSIGYTLTLRP